MQDGHVRQPVDLDEAGLTPQPPGDKLCHLDVESDQARRIGGIRFDIWRTAFRVARPSDPTIGDLTRLYTGTGAFDVVGRRKTWYVLFGVVVLICVGSIVFRGFNLGIDFTGGTQIQFPSRTAAAPADVESVRGVYERVVGAEPAAVQTVGTGDSASVVIRSEALDPNQVVALKQALFDTFGPIGGDGAPSAAVISDSAVSASWGGQITTQALIALAVFLVLVTIFLAFYFERAMAVAASTKPATRLPLSPRKIDAGSKL